MNAATVAVLVGLFALVGLALARAWRKGAPCECGCDSKKCSKCRSSHGE